MGLSKRRLNPPPSLLRQLAWAEAKKKKAAGVAPRRGKKLRSHLKNIVQRIHKEGPVPITKAVTVLKQAKRAKFDETVEIHMSLGVDTTQSDQLVRGTVPLPFGVGKTVRVVVFCQGDNVGKAKEAGADFAGSDDLLEKIQKQNWLEFDVALATQDLDGQGQPPRQGARPARPDADPQGRAPSSPAMSPRRSRISRLARSNSAPTKAATSTPASAS